MSVRNFLLLSIFLSWILPLWAQQKEAMKCSACGHMEERVQAKFCIRCGEKLTKIISIAVCICPECKKILDKNGIFCAFCGKKGVVSYQEMKETSYEPPNPAPKEDSPDMKPKNEAIPDVPKSCPPSSTENGTATLVKTEDVLFPGVSLLEKHTLDEGLRHTSEQRTIVYSLYTSGVQYKNIEEYYRAHPLKFSVIKFSEELLQTPVIIWKYKSKDLKTQIEVALYSYTPGKEASWEAKLQKVKNKLAEELKPIRSYEKEIADIEKLIAQKKISQSAGQLRIDDLKRRWNVGANSRSYWQLKAMGKLCELKLNTILITITTSKD